MFQVTLIRPGLTEFDRQHRIQGSLDLPLNAEGELELDTIFESLQGEDLEVLYCSPTNPASSTARQLGERLGIPVERVGRTFQLRFGTLARPDDRRDQRSLPQSLQTMARNPRSRLSTGW